MPCPGTRPYRVSEVPAPPSGPRRPRSTCGAPESATTTPNPQGTRAWAGPARQKKQTPPFQTLHSPRTPRSWLKPGRAAWFRELTTRGAARGCVQLRTPDLLAKGIEDYTRAHNTNPNHFVWPATTQDIFLAKGSPADARVPQAVKPMTIHTPKKLCSSSPVCRQGEFPSGTAHARKSKIGPGTGGGNWEETVGFCFLSFFLLLVSALLEAPKTSGDHRDGAPASGRPSCAIALHPHFFRGFLEAPSRPGLFQRSVPQTPERHPTWVRCLDGGDRMAPVRVRSPV